MRVTETKETKLVDDEILIRQFVGAGLHHSAGNRKAFTTLMERHIKGMRRLLFTLLNGNMEDMEDAEQEILISLFNTLPHFRFKSSFKTYLYRLCRNKAIDLIRKKNRERKILFSISGQPSSNLYEPEAEVLKKERGNRIFKLLFKLREEERSLILLKDVEGLSIKEITKIVGIPEGTIKSRLHRSREKLAELMAGEDI
ncbi:ECF RNA polymerase sigma factor SigW [subsurface metagenome]